MADFVELKTLEELDALLGAASGRPEVIFKHSLTCPISSGVREEVSRLDGTVRLVVVQNSRPVSNEIAERTGVRHESPQALVIRDGRVVYHASHYDITADDIRRAAGTE